MSSNRLLYLGLLILAVVFYFASGIWFSWLLVAVLLALPLLTLLLSLPAMLSCSLEASMVNTAEQGENAVLHLQLRSWPVLPLPEVQIRLNLRTRDNPKDLRYLSRLTRAEGVLALPTDTCGFLAPEFCRGRVYDALGLFRLPLRLPKLEPLAILPPALPPTPLPRLESLLHQQLRPKPGGGAAEQHEIRPYRPGDPVKDIHWKLSLKTDELMIREAQEPLRRRVVLALRTPQGPRERAQNLGNLRWLSRWLLEKDLPHDIVWMEGPELRRAAVTNGTEALNALRLACLAPETSANLPWPLPFQAEWVCPVGTEGGKEP